jgi:hypothetical protein
MEVPMIRKPARDEEVEIFSVPLAKWSIGVLGMMIAVVGKESLLGLILRQTRSEIASLVNDEECTARSQSHLWFSNN